MRLRRSAASVVLSAIVGIVALAPRQARAQDIECDPGDTEVRALRFEGNHALSSGDLALRINTTASNWVRRVFRVVGTKACLDTAEVPRDMRRIEDAYRTAGYYSATVDTSIVPVGKLAVRVTFRINEGPPTLIATDTITGLHDVADSAKVTQDLWLRSGRPLDATRLKADADTIVLRLRSIGYPRADAVPTFVRDPQSHTATVTLSVTPGTRTRIGTIVYDITPVNAKDGVQISEKTAGALMRVKTGDLYSDRAITEAQRNLFQTGAYRHVSVELDTLATDSLVPLHVHLLEDNMHELDTELGWGTLDCFRARGQLINKNFLGGARRLELTGQLSKLGFGYPTKTTVGSNLCGTLRDDRIGSDTVNFFGGATFRPLTWFGPQSAPTFTLYTERRSEFQAYLRRTYIGGEASVTKNLGRLTTPLQLGYTMEYGRTDAQPAVLCAVFQRCDAESQAEITGSARPLAVASAAIARVRTDSPVSATRGSILRLELRTSTPFLGSAAELSFNKGLADASVYLPGGWTNVIALRARAGIIGGGTNGTGGRLPPPQERFYAGGPGSVRGFQQNELGSAVYIAGAKCASVRDAVTAACTALKATPAGVDGSGDSLFTLEATDPTPSRVVPVGGNTLAIGNAEYRFRDPFLPDLLQYTLFVDAGDVWQRGASDTTFRYTGLKWTPGIGVRVFTPFGPVQVNIGYNGEARNAGPAFFESPVNTTTGSAPLFCVAPGNALLVTQQRVGSAIDYTQAAGTCPSSYQPKPAKTFLQHLTFTFSIGPDF